MDDRGQVLLLLECCRSIRDQFYHVLVQERRGHLDRVAWNDSGVEIVEPTGVEVVPRAVFDDYMAMDTVTFPFLKRTVGDLEHADCRRGRLVPIKGIR